VFLLNTRPIVCARNATAVAARSDYAWSVPKLEFGNRKGKKQKMPVRLATNGHLNCKTASSYGPTMVAPRKVST
jgi:hypothetical protein